MKRKAAEKRLFSFVQRLAKPIVLADGDKLHTALRVDGELVQEWTFTANKPIEIDSLTVNYRHAL